MWGSATIMCFAGVDGLWCKVRGSHFAWLGLRGWGLWFGVWRSPAPRRLGCVPLSIYHLSVFLSIYLPNASVSVYEEARSALVLWCFGALYSTHIVASRTPSSYGVIRDKLRRSSPVQGS